MGRPKGTSGACSVCGEAGHNAARHRERAEPVEREGPVVYFLEAVGLDRVKIGWTAKLHARIGELRTLIPVDVEIIRAIPGGQNEETELHRRFRAHRLHGEWFTLSPIRADIEAIESVSLDVLRRCIDCGSLANKNRGRRNLRCRACSQKSNAVSLDGVYTCLDCGVPMSVASMRSNGARPCCHSCAMRRAWSEPGYRERIMAARKLQRKRCSRCGESEPKVAGKYHSACWEAELLERATNRATARPLQLEGAEDLGERRKKTGEPGL